MDMKTLTVNQLKAICKKHSYILARYTDNNLIGINCKIAKLKRFKNLKNVQTNYISFIPANFNEYISHKTPFY